MANQKGVKPANQINSLAQASSIQEKPKVVKRKSSSKPRKKRYFVDVFFTYGNGNIAVTRIYDTIARYAGLTLVTSENKFYKQGDKVLAHSVAKGKIFKVGSISKTNPRAGATTNVSGNTRKKSEVKYHSCHAPSDASIVDVVKWVSTWKRVPAVIKVGRERIFTGSSKAAIEGIQKQPQADPIAAASK